MAFITVHNEVAKVMFLQACVCPHRGGGSASVHAGIPTPQALIRSFNLNSVVIQSKSSL